LVSTNCTYSTDFTDASWENITKIEIQIICNDDTAETIQIYLQDCFLALPYNFGIFFPIPTYYPSITNNAIYVSQLFGNNSNNGLTRAAPVKTIEYALSIATGGTPYICLLDSQVYKPIALDGSYVGIKQTLSYETTIIADYLETPSISAKPGLIDENRVGARADYRTDFYNGSGITYIVKKDGTGPGGYTTITAAYNAASSGDCVEIQDNEIYDEYIAIGKGLTIQAAPGFMPVWSHAADDEILETNHIDIKINGIVFKGSNQVNTYGIQEADNGIFKDCTFMNFGTDTGNANIITYCGANNGQYLENCLFVDNGENVNHISFTSGIAGGTFPIFNCKGLTKGATANNIFIHAGKAVSDADLKIIAYGNEILSGLGNSQGYFIYVADTTSSAYITKVYNLLNDTNMYSLATGANGLKVETYDYLNYLHDNSFAGNNMLSRNILVCDTENNYFKNIVNGAEIAAGTQTVERNIFYNCSGIGFYNTYVGQTNYNIFANCATAYKKSNSYTTLINNLILVNNTVGIENHDGAITVYDSIIYNSPSSGTGITQGTNLNTVDPSFRNPTLDDFSWNGLSDIEADPTIFTDGWGAGAFINPSGAKLNFMFMQLTGYITLPTIATDNTNIGLTYCTVDGAQCGLNESVYNCTQQGVLFTQNGIGARLARISLADGSTIKNVIATGNGVGVLARSGATIGNITCFGNDYGIQGVDWGYFGQKNALEAYLTVSNSIFTQNVVKDYALNQDAINCLFYSSYYDVTPSTAQNNMLDPAYLFPAIKKLGYKVNSDAFGKSLVAGENIGARNLSIINAQIYGDEYDFYYVGTIDSNDNFYALENPQNIIYSLVPINNESTRMIDGTYNVTPTAYVREFDMQWAVPGTDSKISDAMKQAMELAFRTYWIIGFCFDSAYDNGVTSDTYVYYKVDKSKSMQMEGQSYLYNGLPYGQFTLHLIEIPDFVIQDYITC